MVFIWITDFFWTPLQELHLMRVPHAPNLLLTVKGENFSILNKCASNHKFLDA